MARQTAPSHGQQREAILDAAAAHFAESGYASASMAALAQHCGVSKSLLYHYYPAKDAILFDLLHGYLERLLAIVLDVQASGVPPREVLPQLVRRFMREYADSRTRQIVLLNDAAFLPPAERARVIAQQRIIVAAFAQAIRDRSAVDPERASVLAMSVFGLINWTFTWLRPDGALSFEQYAEVVVRLLEGGLDAAAGALSPPADG